MRESAAQSSGFQSLAKTCLPVTLLGHSASLPAGARCIPAGFPGLAPVAAAGRRVVVASMEETVEVVVEKPSPAATPKTSQGGALR